MQVSHWAGGRGDVVEREGQSGGRMFSKRGRRGAVKLIMGGGGTPR